MTVSVVTGVVRTRTLTVSTSVVTRVTVLYRSASRPSLNCMADLHNWSEFFHNCTVGVADTKDLTEVLAECAVVHEVVVLILVANVLLTFSLAFENSAEPVEKAVG